MYYTGLQIISNVLLGVHDYDFSYGFTAKEVLRSQLYSLLKLAAKSSLKDLEMKMS